MCARLAFSNTAGVTRIGSRAMRTERADVSVVKEGYESDSSVPRRLLYRPHSQQANHSKPPPAPIHFQNPFACIHTRLSHAISSLPLSNRGALAVWFRVHSALKCRTAGSPNALLAG